MRPPKWEEEALWESSRRRGVLKSLLAVAVASVGLGPVSLFADAVPECPASLAISVLATSGPHGTVSPSGELSILCGRDQVFAFTPDAGYVVAAVQVDGRGEAAIPRYVFSAVGASHSLYVTFRPVAPMTPRIVQYLEGISGRVTVAGQHNKEPNTAPAAATARALKIARSLPGLWSGDFLFVGGSVEPASRWEMTYEAKRQWDAGALVNLMFHACPPTQAEPCEWEGGVKSALSDTEWSDLVTDGGALNASWKRRLDAISPYLEFLKDNGVEVLFRPLHEMNQRLFWWGGRPGAGGTSRLYRLTHDYLVNVKGLTNLVFVWDVQDFWRDKGSTASIVEDIEDYDPGRAYWDVVALDPYGTHFTRENYDAMRRIAGDKPMAIGETDLLPSPDVLRAQPRWVFFMLWPDFIQDNAAALESVYSSERVVTLKRMPGWR